MSTSVNVNTPCLTTGGQVVTTTVTETRVRGRRARLFVTGFLQLIFGGFSLIPILLLAPAPVAITACAWLAFTGMCGVLGACVSSDKASTSVKYDANTRTQKVITNPPQFPRVYTVMMVIAFLLGVASAVQGIILISVHPYWYVNLVYGPLITGIGIFFALNQMLMICCVSPMVRAHTSSSEQVHVIQGAATGTIPSAPAAYGAYSSAPNFALQSGSQGPLVPTNQQIYPYIDEPTKEDPPTYTEATRNDYQKQPTAPDF